MRLACILCLLVIQFVVGQTDGGGFDPNEATQLIEKYIRPRLKKLNSTLELNSLKICKCSPENNECSRSTGVSKLLTRMFNSTDQLRWRYTCVTDGVCYQNQLRSTSKKVNPEPSYGCFDQAMEKQEEIFHPATRHCFNNSQTIWKCCDDMSFCANQTLIYAKYVRHPDDVYREKMVRYTAYIGFGLVLFLLLVILMSYYRHEIRRKFDSLRSYLPQSHQKNVVLKDMDGTISDTVDTQSTHLRTEIDMIMSQLQGKESSPHEMAMIEMLRRLEESSTGTGYGQQKLMEHTIGTQIKQRRNIGCGRFGAVYAARYMGEEVAVKIFKLSDEAAFAKEVNIYETSMLRHPNVLRFIGSDRISYNSLAFELMLVTEYHQNGSLHEYLERNTVDMSTCLTIIRTTVCGLAFLHTKINGNTPSSSKPAIAHRDIKSRNIMVRADMTCAIGDLGLSVKAGENGEVIGYDNTKAGTIRYLAPEILNDTLQTTIFDGYQMADVYACGLVMWEVLCRCEEFDISARTPLESIPYVEYCNRDPSDEEMYEIVCERKYRPTESPEWRNNPHYKAVVDIMESCWNQNPTARITAIMARMKLERQSEVWRQYMMQSIRRPHMSPMRVHDHNNIPTARQFEGAAPIDDQLDPLLGSS